MVDLSFNVEIAVGLGHVETSIFPMIAVTAKELDVKGTRPSLAEESQS